MHKIQQDNEEYPRELVRIKEKIAQAHYAAQRSSLLPMLIAVSKGQPASALERFLLAGQRIYGENRVQEAESKWRELKNKYKNTELHLIGPLQSNKVAQAVALFDVIETVDREKIALALGREMKKQHRSLPCLIQVNIGREPQKAGILPEEAEAFLAFCREQAGLEIRGLMCIPPADQPPARYFAQMQELQRHLNLECLSMGMSGDFEEAIRFGATHVRVGTALFGERG